MCERADRKKFVSSFVFGARSLKQLIVFVSRTANKLALSLRKVTYEEAKVK